MRATTAATTFVLGLLLAGCGSSAAKGSSGAGGKSGGGADAGNTGGAGGRGPCASAADCDDTDACTVDACGAGTCEHTPAQLDDGGKCALTTCDPKKGILHTPISVDDNDACTVDSCDPKAGVIHAPVKVDDNDACTVDACDPKAGVSHAPISCDDNDVCTTDTCNPLSGCVHTAVDPNDNNSCTADTCDPVLGVLHGPVSCDDKNACTNDSCDPVVGCFHAPTIVDDNNACTLDSCDPVLGIMHTSIDPNDGNACTIDSCDPVLGVQHKPVNCDDGNPCTVDTCDQITGCLHTSAVYFTENFSNGNAQGWTMDPTWEIGVATVSGGQNNGNPDPGFDHTQNGDNMLAGVVIGGNAPTQVMAAPSYLTSPAIDLSAVSGPVWLDFWRWLNSDYMPHMQNYVEVWDGAVWKVLWQSSIQPAVQDAQWVKLMGGLNPVIYDVTQYKNAGFRFRFGYRVKQGGAYTVSSWNVDDVRLVAGPKCP